MSKISCRFYRNPSPAIDDTAMVIIRSITDIGAYVELLEYNRLEGMILLSELSRRRIRSINKLIRVGKSEAVLVIRIDAGKSYIDLSKRRVTPEDIKKCEERYIRAKTVYHILLYAAEQMGITTNEGFEKLMEDVAWRFDDKFKDVGGAYEGFKRVIIDPTLLDETNLSEEHKSILLTYIRRRLEPKKVKVRSDVEVACYTSEGIEAVKASLLTGIEVSKSEGLPVKISLIAPPIYMISTIVTDRKHGVSVIEKVVETIKNEIISREGFFNLKLAPKILSEYDEAELNRRLEDLEQANELLDGDEDTSDEDDIDGESPINGSR